MLLIVRLIVLSVIELWVHCYIKGRGRPKKEEQRISRCTERQSSLLSRRGSCLCGDKLIRTHRTKPDNNNDDDDDDDNDDRMMMTTTMMMMIVCVKTSFYFYSSYFIYRWFRVIIELKKITLKCKLPILQTEADDNIVKTSSLGRKGKDRGDSIQQ